MCTKQTMRLVETDRVICFNQSHGLFCKCLTLCQSTLLSKLDIEYRLDINKNMKSTVSKTESVVNRSIGHNPKFELFREGAINLETMMPKALSSHTVVCMTQVKIPQERLVKKLWISTCYLR